MDGGGVSPLLQTACQRPRILAHAQRRDLQMQSLARRLRGGFRAAGFGAGGCGLAADFTALGFAAATFAAAGFGSAATSTLGGSSNNVRGSIPSSGSGVSLKAADLDGPALSPCP